MSRIQAGINPNAERIVVDHHNRGIVLTRETTSGTSATLVSLYVIEVLDHGRRYDQHFTFVYVARLMRADRAQLW